GRAHVPADAGRTCARHAGAVAQALSTPPWRSATRQAQLKKKSGPSAAQAAVCTSAETLCETLSNRPASGAGRVSFSEGQRLHAEAFVEMFDLAEQLVELALQARQTFVIHQ